MINHSLKARFLTITITFIFLTSSCDTKEELSTNNTQTIHRLTNEDIGVVTKAIKTKDDEIQSKRNGLVSKTFTDPAPGEDPYIEYQDLLADKNLSIEIDDRTAQILDQSYEENIQYVNDLHLFTINEIAAVTAFKNELENTQDFNTSISNFENAILLLPMSNKKLQRFYYFIDGLKAMNVYDPYFFNGGSISAKSKGGLFGSCLSASIGVGIAFVGLATIEVGSFGAATGVAVAGFIWASAEWGAACKGGNKKEKFPPQIIKPYKKANLSYITFDENGDITDGPITLFLTPR